jgi:hypothetical protein
MEPLGMHVAISMALGAVLLPAALSLAMLSWLFGKGALMEASAQRMEEQS